MADEPATFGIGRRPPAAARTRTHDISARVQHQWAPINHASKPVNHYFNKQAPPRQPRTSDTVVGPGTLSAGPCGRDRGGGRGGGGGGGGEKGYYGFPDNRKIVSFPSPQSHRLFLSFSVLLRVSSLFFILYSRVCGCVCVCVFFFIPLSFIPENTKTLIARHGRLSRSSTRSYYAAY